MRRREAPLVTFFHYFLEAGLEFWNPELRKRALHADVSYREKSVSLTKMNIKRNKTWNKLTLQADENSKEKCRQRFNYWKILDRNSQDFIHICILLPALCARCKEKKFISFLTKWIFHRTDGCDLSRWRKRTVRRSRHIGWFSLRDGSHRG